ncbi:hypothetical protein DEO72_LG2g3542 [Vigna unguiculata]|uniref:Uncharacterized protein n=1 Tax=Vigna unguiculata TaxID=3917 RepID=A0A4D6L3X5_VIGUN|nr:hypothetical protein DEO72_LG2g3542 [Vigna unguiculata]
MLEEQLQQEILGKGSYFVFMIMCMIKKPALMTLCLRAMNFHALCDRIRGKTSAILAQASKPRLCKNSKDSNLVLLEHLIQAESPCFGQQVISLRRACFT